MSENTTGGWDAITARLTEAFPDQPNAPQWAPPLPPQFGDVPINGISVYRATEPVPHWLYVTYGFSDLFDAGLDFGVPEESAFGFELVFRLADDAALDRQAEPPMWVVSLLVNMAKYVFSSGNRFRPGHHLPTNGPINLATPDTLLRGLGFLEDAQLGTIATPNGSVRFLHAFGVTERELRAGRRWNMRSFLELVTQRHRVTDLDRAEVLDDPAFADEVERRTQAEGSTTGTLFVDQLAISQDGATHVLEIGATAAPGVAELLPLRIPFGWPLVLVHVGHEVTVTLDADAMPADTARELAAKLRPEAGEYGAGDWVIRVVQSTIRDPEGNVVDVVG